MMENTRKTANPNTATLVVTLLSAAVGCLACNRTESKGQAPQASASAPAVGSGKVPVAEMAGGVPIPPEKVEKVVNPKREKAYAGPTGSVSGVVVMTGDEPPAKPEWISQVPADCLAARETYKHLFREGMMRSVADVFVAVTGYDGYVPQAEDARVVGAKSCAFEARTIGLTFGQGLDVASRDRRAYVPELLGARTTAQLVATPGGKPVRLYPEKPGSYVLVDSMRTFAAADVYVVAYATFDVTGLDGKFQIENVPVGKVKLNALLPAAMLTTAREVEVKAGQTTNVDLELAFDKKQYEELAASGKARGAAADVAALEARKLKALGTQAKVP